MEKVATLTHAVRMLCDDLRDDSTSLDHPLVRRRVASMLASALLVGLPHNHSRVFEAAERSIAPASVRRAERFIEENAVKAIGLADVASAAGVSARALQMAFRRFRDTTPMAHLRALRLELARSELARAGQNGGSVASVAQCARLRVAQPVRRRLQGPLPRAAFRNAAPRRRRTLSYRALPHQVARFGAETGLRKALS